MTGGARVVPAAACRKPRLSRMLTSEKGPPCAGEVPQEMPREIDYHGLLGVARDATEAEIRERFRSLAREAHPDRAPAANTRTGAQADTPARRAEQPDSHALRIIRPRQLASSRPVVYRNHNI